MIRTTLTTALLVISPLATPAQDVVATRAGLIYSHEGEVHVDEQALETVNGRFSMLPAQSELRVNDGEATLVLAPGILLDVRADSVIRLLDNGLMHPSIELTAGSVRLRWKKGPRGRQVTMNVGDIRVDIVKRGDYTLEMAPMQLTVTKGQAVVSARGESHHAETGDEMLLARDSQVIALQQFGTSPSMAGEQ